MKYIKLKSLTVKLILITKTYIWEDKTWHMVWFAPSSIQRYSFNIYRPIHGDETTDAFSYESDY